MLCQCSSSKTCENYKKLNTYYKILIILLIQTLKKNDLSDKFLKKLYIIYIIKTIHGLNFENKNIIKILDIILKRVLQ